MTHMEHYEWFTGLKPGDKVRDRDGGQRVHTIQVVLSGFNSERFFVLADGFGQIPASRVKHPTEG